MVDLLVLQPYWGRTDGRTLSAVKMWRWVWVEQWSGIHYTTRVHVKSMNTQDNTGITDFAAGP